MSKISNYFRNLKNIKTNFNKVKSNPYTAVAFEYKAYKMVVWIIGFMIVAQLSWSIYDIILTGNGKPMSMISGAFTLLVMVILCWKLYQFVKQKKQIMDDYLANPVKIDNIPEEKKLDVRKEVDEFLAKFDEDGRLKERRK